MCLQSLPLAPRRLVVLLAAGVLLVTGCRSVVPVPQSDTRSATPDGPLRQQIVIVVHGDADYLYHDPDGTPHQADEATLREAFAAARALPRAEVFVFHQRPQRRVLGVVPRSDGTLYHFRRGRLLTQQTYDRTPKTPLAAEARLVGAHRATVDSSVLTAALYYGHAVPERPRPGYHHSHPGVAFGVDLLADGLGRMRPSGQFDAVVLSTCDGGTPHTVVSLAPRARHLLAAPRDLHLSFLDADLLADLAGTTDPADWTHQFAARAFDRLTARVQTGVTLAAYDLGTAAPTARRLSEQVAPDTSASPTGADLHDCRRLAGAPVDTIGVRVWDRPPRFGRRADRASHSGWGCPPARP